MTNQNEPTAAQVILRPVDAPHQQPHPENHWALLHLGWHRKWIILFVTMLGMGLGYLFFLKQTPIYESVAQVLIVKKQPNYDIGKVEVSSSYDSTHQSLISSPLVLQKAIRNPKFGLDHSARLNADGDPVGLISKSLIVTGQTNDRTAGSILKLAYQSPNPQECPKVLDAIVESYQEFLHETYKNVSQDAINLFTKARVDLDNQLSQVFEDYGDFRALAPALFNTESGTSIHADRLLKIEELRSKTVIENTRIQATIDAVESVINRGGESPRELLALNLIVGRLNQDEKLKSTDNILVQPPRMDELQDELLFPVMLEHELLLQKYGPDHPKVQLAKRKIDLTRDHMETQKSDHEDASIEGNRDFYDVYLHSLREEMQLNTQTIAEMERLFEQEKVAAQELAAYMMENQNFRSEIERKKKLFDTVISQLEEISLVKDAGGAALLQISNPADGIQVKPDLIKILGAFTLLGLFGGFGIAYIIDLSDRRFRTPEEVRETLRVPVIGHIPFISDVKSADPNVVEGAENMSPTLTTFHQPKGRTSEAYRAVRTALYFSTRGRGNQVIQVTSPSPGDGKSTTAANIAITIAQSGKKVLLIDADFRRPRCHRLFNAENQVGMSTVIAGDVELLDAIQTTPVENLSLLPCGKRPKNPAELLSSKRFEELVGVLREQFEIVIIDTPPVLAVTDPLNVAPRVDGILVVLRLTKSARSAGSRALDLLEHLGVNVLGLVVNGVGKTAGYGGYTYGTYGRYGYSGYGGYGYGSDGPYGYRYGGPGYGDVRYGEEGDKTYYGDGKDE